MRIIRFIGEDDQTYWGEEPADGATEAVVLGDGASGAGCRYPEWKLPEIAAGGLHDGGGKKVGIKRLIAPKA